MKVRDTIENPIMQEIVDVLEKESTHEYFMDCIMSDVEVPKMSGLRIDREYDERTMRPVRLFPYERLSIR